MKRFILFVIIVFVAYNATTQNLVPNPGFEEYTECPQTFQNLDFAFPWFNITWSSDYFNACSSANWVSVPINSFGNQLANSGEAYAGFSAFSISGDPDHSNREYISTWLDSPLQEDSFYRVEFYVSLGDKFVYACDCIEVWFTDSLPPDLPISNELIEGNPQLHSPKGYFLQDKVNWMKLAWTYKARGGEELMIIGNFKGDEDSDYIVVPDTFSNQTESYYYIDDVMVKKIPYNYAVLDIGIDTIVCDSNIVMTLTAQPVYDSYLWSTGDTSQSITIYSPGTYWVDVGFDECFITDTINIEYREPETDFFSSTLELCPEDLPYFFEGPENMDTYSWSTGSDSSGILIAEAGTYWLEACYPCGDWKDTIDIEVLYPELIDLGNDTILCDQDIFVETLTVTDVFDSYLWNTGETTSSITTEVPGTYWVTATYKCGEVSDTIYIINQSLLSLDLGRDTTFCRNENISIKADFGFDSYLWNTGEESEEIEVDFYGAYWVEASYACGILSDTIVIYEPPELWIQLPEDTIIDLGQTITLAPELPVVNFQYHWEPSGEVTCANCEQTNISPIENTWFELTIVDEYGCTAVSAIYVEVDKKRRVFIPNLFSPNDDQINDRFTIFGGAEVEKIISVKIFNRWGGLIFENRNIAPNDTNAGWDGTLNGEKVNTGVYVVLVTVLFKDGHQKMYSGDLTLLR